MTQGKKILLVASSAILLIFIYFAAKNLKIKEDFVIMTESGAEAELPQNVSGLRVELLQYGNGDRQVKNGDYILIRYEGRLSDGTLFATNMGKSEPLGVYIGKGETIPGWEKGLLGMRVNEKRKLVVSPEMAYGKNGSPKDGVPADTTLIYEIHLLNIVE
jgi:FKBP-type peptidyl-prolyl cis-trans isomerase